MSEPTPIERLSLRDLLNLQDDRLSAALSAKADMDAVKAEVARRYGEAAKQSLSQAEKTHGTVTLPLQDGISAKGEIKKEVKWDSAKLMALAQTMPWERVVALFKIDFSMSETVYKGVAALSPETQAKIDEARTIVIKEPALLLVKAG